MFFSIFTSLSTIVSVYLWICFIRIIITWFPSIHYSQFGTILSKITDPYLNIFRNIKFLRFNGLDFSPILSIGLLSALSSIFRSIATMQRFSLGIILAIILNMAWSIFYSVCGFLVILLIIRLIFNLLGKDSSSRIWYTLDQILNPIIYKISGIFMGRSYRNYRTSIIITICVGLVITLAGAQLIRFISGFLLTMPF